MGIRIDKEDNINLLIFNWEEINFYICNSLVIVYVFLMIMRFLNLWFLLNNLRVLVMKLNLLLVIVFVKICFRLVE